MKKYKKSLFIFRRDLRIDDNTALIEALKQSEEVLPCFIFDERQISPTNNYRSLNALQFMVESLEDLELQLKKKKGRLYYFFGVTESFLERFVEKQNIGAIFVNKDYTPFSKKRDEKIKEICEKNKIDFNEFEDALLNSPENTLKKDKTPYTIFTAYYNNAKKIEIKMPLKNNYTNYSKEVFKFENKTLLINIKNLFNEKIAFHGGTSEGKKILKKIKRFDNYYFIKDFPKESTTLLSAHNKFGTISIREVYWSIVEQLGPYSPILRQLYWRDFFTNVAYHYSKVFGNNFNKKFDTVVWINDSKNFELWKNASTGYPIIDAGMQELNTTGFMHNRVRMIIASFLTKDLHIDWREGEKYFAQKLIDYDPSVNNGNWQWVAGTGCDAAPYFRIFNPWIQQKKFDKDCDYIKKWIPELKEIEPKIIHNPFLVEKVYIKQIINHKEEIKKTKKYYKFN